MLSSGCVLCYVLVVYRVGCVVCCVVWLLCTVLCACCMLRVTYVLTLDIGGKQYCVCFADHQVTAVPAC